MKRQHFWILAFVLLATHLAHAATGNIDPNAKFAWAENAGFINFAPAFGGTTVTKTSLSGYAYCETVGWVKLGSDGGGPYGNTSATDYGVNVAGPVLTGYAWSENAGWIRFNPTGGGVTLGLDGTLDGYAWSETLGYVHFKNAAPQYNVAGILTTPNQPPFVPPISSDQNPGLLNQPVLYQITATDVDTPFLFYTFNFGDGSPDLNGTFPQGTVVTLSHVYAAYTDGVTVSLTITDGYTPVTQTTLQTVPMPASTGAGIVNTLQDQPPVVTPTTVPLGGLAVSVLSSFGGVVELNIDDSNFLLIRSNFDLTTDWGDISGRASKVTGTNPVHQFTNRGIFVATTTANMKGTGMLVGKARLTLALSSKETGDFPGHLKTPSQIQAEKNPQTKSTDVTAGVLPNDKPAIETKRIKGKFDFTGKTPDLVSYTGTITLPPGLDLRKDYEFWIAIGNIVVKSTIVKGKGTAFSVQNVVKSLKISTKSKITFLTIGGEQATVSVTYSAMNTVAGGFNTEGISNKSTDTTGGRSAPRKIQVAMLVDGAPFQAVTPVDFNVSSGSDFGVISGRAAK